MNHFYKETLIQIDLLYFYICAMTGISSVDVGNYTCEVGGPRNTVLASVTHQLYVRG